MDEKVAGKNLNSDQLINFLENTLPNNITTYYDNFIKMKIKVSDNLVDTVSQFRKNKVTKAIIESHKRQEELLK